MRVDVCERSLGASLSLPPDSWEHPAGREGSPGWHLQVACTVGPRVCTEGGGRKGQLPGGGKLSPGQPGMQETPGFLTKADRAQALLQRPRALDLWGSAVG